MAPRVLCDEHEIFGNAFDIHGGGMDLKFPHHECEIAQNAGATGEGNSVGYWMHGNMLTVNGRKMAKSEGNGFTPDELITGQPPVARTRVLANDRSFLHAARPLR